MSQDSETYYERRLQAEIEAIEAQIHALRADQAALRRQLVKARWQNSTMKDVSRKNSANRIMIEQRVLSDLANAGKPQASQKLYKSALSVNFELKETTFRTYLHRMKQKGLIEAPSRSMWRLPKR